MENSVSTGKGSIQGKGDVTGWQVMLFVLLLVIVVVTNAHARTVRAPSPELPQVLQPWVNWVLHDREEAVVCVPRWNDADDRCCSWPGPLVLMLGQEGGTFEQSWEILHEGWVALPGAAGQWPFHVQINGVAVPVVRHDGGPAVRLLPGQHDVTGAFRWSVPPEYLQLAPGDRPFFPAG